MSQTCISVYRDANVFSFLVNALDSRGETCKKKEKINKLTLPQIFVWCRAVIHTHVCKKDPEMHTLWLDAIAKEADAVFYAKAQAYGLLQTVAFLL